jgi:hypothetical protein
MPNLRVHNLIVSLDGYASGDGQSLEQVPIVLGRGVRLWDGLDGLHERHSIETVTVPSGAIHLFFTR